MSWRAWGPRGDWLWRPHSTDGETEGKRVATTQHSMCGTEKPLEWTLHFSSTSLVSALNSNTVSSPGLCSCRALYLECLPPLLCMSKYLACKAQLWICGRKIPSSSSSFILPLSLMSFHPLVWVLPLSFVTCHFPLSYNNNSELTDSQAIHMHPLKKKSSFYKWAKWGAEKLNNLPKAAQLMASRAWVLIQTWCGNIVHTPIFRFHIRT